MGFSRILTLASIPFILLGGLWGLLTWFPGVHERLGTVLKAVSLPLALLVVLVLVLVVPAIWLGLIRGVRRRVRRERIASPDREELARAGGRQLDRAEELIKRVLHQPRRDELERELEQLRAERKQTTSEFGVVVFGTGSAGKTSLINALLGRQVGKTEAVMGTTRRGEFHTYSLHGVEGVVYLTDTPGLSEAGADGKSLEAEAHELAKRADLLLFVLDHDLIRGEYESLVLLLRLGKRAIVVFNKRDRFSDEDRESILAKLRERLRGLIDDEDIVAVAASPRPVPVRIQQPDGSTETVLEEQEPDIRELRSRIAEILRREGAALHAGNLLVKARLLGEAAQNELRLEQVALAREVIEKYQWITAGSVFANPIPALDLIAGGAVQFDMITALGRVYGVELSGSQVRMLGGQMIQGLLRLGLVEAATSLLAGVFKRTLVGFAAGGAVQALTLAYLTRISGEALAAYFRNGQSWGEGGVNAEILRQFELQSRSEFLQEFARQAFEKLSQRVLQARAGITSETTEQSSR